MTIPTPLQVAARTPKRTRPATKSRHAHCLNGERCTGPGCKAVTGKTARDKAPRRFTDSEIAEFN